MRNIWDKICREIKTHILCFAFFFGSRAIYVIMCRNVVEPVRPEMTVRRTACCIPKATNTCSEYVIIIASPRGTAVSQWLRCCATNRKVAGSIPDGIIGIFHWHISSDRTMALGSTQPLTEMSTRSISWGKSGRCVVRLTTLPPFT